MRRLSAIISLLLASGCAIVEGEENGDSMSPKRGAMGDGWSKTGELVSGSNLAGYSLQANFTEDDGGSGAKYYTVQFGIPTPPSNGVFDAVAEIAWNTDGTDVRRLVSVGNGVTVSGTAQGVKVTVMDRTNPLAFPPVAGVSQVGRSYRVDTLVTSGTRPSQQMPPRLFPATVIGVNIQGFYVIPAAAVVIVPIPQNAGVISVKIDARSVTGFAPMTGGDMAVAFASPALVESGVFDPALVTDWVPVPPAASSLVLGNLTVAKDIELYLAFGIEG